MSGYDDDNYGSVPWQLGALIGSIRNEENQDPDNGEISDADSDMLELENDIEKYNRSVHEFLAAHRGEAAPNAGKSSKPKGALRGPRKAAEPRGDIKARLSKANQAFLSGDYPAARNFIFEVIRINAETHQAWTTLASIFREEGMPDKALMSMVYGAHLRPKDIASWIKVAQFAASMTTDVENALNTARLCYSAALRADSKNLQARMGRAEVAMGQNRPNLAIVDYRMILNQTPLDIEVIRKLADACLESTTAQNVAEPAIEAYAEFITFEYTQIHPEQRKFNWSDVIIYTELLSATQQYEKAIYELKRLSRWLITGSQESFWANWTEDDREFDLHNDRRVQATGDPANHFYYDIDPLHIELRVQLGVNRLRLGEVDEGMMHLSCLHPSSPGATEVAQASPYLIQIAADQIFDCNMETKALPYYQLLRQVSGFDDPRTLYQLGRCYRITNNLEAAEECFLAAIEADEGHIEARVELATIYEEAKEGEEALILVTEALALRNALRNDEEASGGSKPKSSTRSRKANAKPRTTTKRRKREPGMLPSRFRTKRLGDPTQRRKAEQERMKGLLEKYREAQSLRARVSEDDEIRNAWVGLTRELIDDFRSSKKFYTWDRYLKLLGHNENGDPSGDGTLTELDIMAERLSKAVLPVQSDVPEPTVVSTDDNYLGVPFDEWLDLFLDYSICVCRDGNYAESAAVCHATRDSIVFRGSQEYTTRIYLAWASCAAYAGDEEACVSVSRNLIRDNPVSADAYRMFAVMSRICQSKASWYNSGPAQKFLLRQIKAMDTAANSSPSDLESIMKSKTAPDANVLMLYGHVLFMSTSYTYALHYFLRARSMDPDNPAINFSIGLGYIHYALKRQSVNRQYLILQGLSFVFRYRDTMHQFYPDYSLEADYNVARVAYLIGLPHLATTFVKMERYDEPVLSNMLSDLELMVYYNQYIMQSDLNNKLEISQLIL